MSADIQLFWEIEEHLMNDEVPSHYLKMRFDGKEDFKYPFNLLDKLKQTEQSPKHHPEGNVWNHTLLVVNEAAKAKNRSSDSRAFMWAALLHDIGKPEATKLRKGKITSYDHDKIGAKLAEQFLIAITDDIIFIKAVVALVRWHMQILFVVNDLPFTDVKAMKQQVDVKEVALLGLCDRLGRLKVNRVEEENNIKTFLEKCGGK